MLKAFLKNYTVPFIQLEPKKVILVFSHEHNTFDKKILLDGSSGSPLFVPSDKTIDLFIKNDYEKFMAYDLNEYLPILAIHDLFDRTQCVNWLVQMPSLEVLAFHDKFCTALVPSTTINTRFYYGIPVYFIFILRIYYKIF